MHSLIYSLPESKLCIALGGSSSELSDESAHHVNYHLLSKKIHAVLSPNFCDLLLTPIELNEAMKELRFWTKEG